MTDEITWYNNSKRRNYLVVIIILIIFTPTFLSISIYLIDDELPFGFFIFTYLLFSLVFAQLLYKIYRAPTKVGISSEGVHIVAKNPYYPNIVLWKNITSVEASHTYYGDYKDDNLHIIHTINGGEIGLGGVSYWILKLIKEKHENLYPPVSIPKPPKTIITWEDKKISVIGIAISIISIDLIFPLLFVLSLFFKDMSQMDAFLISFNLSIIIGLIGFIISFWGYSSNLHISKEHYIFKFGMAFSGFIVVSSIYIYIALTAYSSLL